MPRKLRTCRDCCTFDHEAGKCKNAYPSFNLPPGFVFTERECLGFAPKKGEI